MVVLKEFTLRVRARLRVPGRVHGFVWPILVPALVAALSACPSGDKSTAVTNVALAIQSALGTGSGTVAGSGLACDIVGNLQSGTCIKEFAPNTDIALAATAATGSVFVGWGGVCASAGTGTCLFKLAAATTVTANFAPFTFPVTVTAAATSTGNGTVSGNGGIACTIAAASPSGTCTATFTPATAVTLTAAAASGGHVFGGWGGDCSGTAATCALSVSSSKSVTASFRVPTSLTVTSGAGDGNGTVTGGAINCTVTAATQSGTCSAVTPDTSTVLLTATAAAGGHTFAGWGGACSGVAATCSVAMNLVRSVTARFNQPLFALSLASGNGTGNGTIAATFTNGNLSCTITANAATGTCSANIVQGLVVALTASAAPGGHTFAGWGGACSGVLTTCNVTMSQARSVTAAFTAPPTSFPLTVTSGGGTGDGTVTGGGVNCNVSGATQTGTCNATLATGAAVTLTAAAINGGTFNGWGGACAGVVTTCNVTMSQARAVTASFTAPTLFALTVSSGGGTGNGTVTTTSINCIITGAAASGTCTSNYASGTLLTLTATPNAGGHTFSSWGGGVCAGSLLTCNVTMSQARSVTASFNPPSSLTIANGGGNGNGSVTSDKSSSCIMLLGGAPDYLPITVGGNCVVNYPAGTVVNLQAAANSGGYTFVGWSGGGCSGTGSCLVTVSGATTVTAKFNAPSLTDVQTQVFTVYCNACHSTTILNTNTNSFNNLVNVNTVNMAYAAAAGAKRVLPYDDSKSYVIGEMKKLAGYYPMPTTATVVPANLIDLVKNWINGGAKATQP